MTLDKDKLIDAMALKIQETTYIYSGEYEPGKFNFLSMLPLDKCHIYAEAALAALQDCMPELPVNANISDLKAYIKILEGYRELWTELKNLGK